ncbi:hypothetical protein I4U23_017085 [Adineta vaga]|nr:hypothetical protein I4U23_017085 [Adineta vaga]
MSKNWYKNIADLHQQIEQLYKQQFHKIIAFYVIVLFIPVESDLFFVGGKSTDKFIRIIVQHLAKQFPNDKRKKSFSAKYENAISSFIKDKEVSSDLWRENSLIPPIKYLEIENEWARINKPIPYSYENNYWLTLLNNF